MTPRAQTPLVRGTSNPENLTSLALLWGQMQNEKESETTKKGSYDNFTLLL